jgi:hypothetical protein
LRGKLAVEFRSSLRKLRSGGASHTGGGEAPTEGHSDVSDREAIDRFVERIVISPKSIEIHLREPRAVEATQTNRSSAAPHARDSDEDTAIAPAPVITVPWNAPAFVSVKGVLHQPHHEGIDLGDRGFVRRQRAAFSQSGRSACRLTDRACDKPAQP